MRLLTLFFLIATTSVFAQQKNPIIFSGVVTDSLTGSPVAGATIYFSDARIGTSADAAGRFILRNIPAGHYLVEVSSAGYTARVIHVDLLQQSEWNFKLYPSVLENQGVTVTGVASATSTRITPVPVTLIRKNELLQYPSTNIVDALAHLPGISQISTGPSISKPVIRGMSFNRVIVMNDGVRQEGQQWGEEHGVEIDEYSVARAEVLKGAASLMYGSDAIGGVIHYITNTPVTEGTVKANVFTAYQTNNQQVGMHANIAGNNNGFNWNAYGSYKNAKDYKNKYDGRVLNSRFNERNFGGYIGLNKKWGFSHLVFSSFDQDLGLVEGDRDAGTGGFIIYPGTGLERLATESDLESRSIITPRQNVQHYKIISDNSFALGKTRLKANMGFQNSLRKEYGDPLSAEEELFFDLKTYNYNFQFRLPEDMLIETTVGLSGMYQTNKNLGEEALIPDYDLFDLGGFVYGQRSWDKLTMTGGLRFDNRSVDSKLMMEGGDTKFSPFRQNFNNVSGSIGVSYYPDDHLTFKGNVARGFRTPNLPELASNGAHEGTNRFEYGTRTLNTERSWQFDAGVDADYEHISLSLSAFYNEIHDYIFYRRLESVSGGDSIIIIDTEEFEAFRYTQQNASLRGIEFSSDIHPHPLDWLHFENSFSFVRGTFSTALDGSRNLPLIPAPRWMSELRGNFSKPSKSMKNLYVRFQVETTFKQDVPFTGYNTETPTNGYSLLNAGAGVDVGSKRTLFSLHLSANNITDAAYQNHLSRLKYTAVNEVTGRQGVFNSGRNFSFRLNVPLSFTIK